MLDLPPWPEDVATGWPLLRLVTDGVVSWSDAERLTLLEVAMLGDTLAIRADANDAATEWHAARARREADRRRR